MAIYHFSAKLISRANGSSALAAAAYRSASRLHDQRLDRAHDFSNKAGVVHSEVMLPDGAPEHLGDREALWNAVEAAEVRKDAQLAREVEFAIPRELDQAEGIRLAREFVQREFVDHGMIADLNVHWDVESSGEPKPHAHVMLTTREVGEDGFGAKVRDWNRTELLQHWRQAWAEHVNSRLAELDIDARVDHRSLEAQGIELEPQHKIGPAAARMAGQGLESERLDEHREIARSNGEKLLARPALALDAITHSQATFTARDLAMFVHRHSDGKEQFDRVMVAVKAAPALVALGKDGRGDERFTSRDMLETEQRLERAADGLAQRAGHGLPTAARERAINAAGRAALLLSDEQKVALDHVLRKEDLSIVVGYAGTGKSTMLGVARDGWERAGYQVHGLALSGIAAENLESGSGIRSRTIASLEHQWSQGGDLLTSNDVLVIDEAGMIGSRQMERILSQAEKRGAKVVLIGDPEQLQAIEAGAAFRSLAERHGAVEITHIRRQWEGWQRDATRQLATERTGDAIRAYEKHGMVHAAETRELARASLIEHWERDRQADPDASRIILTHTNDEVRALNIAARDRLRAAGEIRYDVTVRTERGARAFAPGDRIMFLKNERSLGVKNGSLGTVYGVTTPRMVVILDDGREAAFNLKDYNQIDHGYAATMHKAQGMTVDHTHVLATPGLDRHATYVALSRHREGLSLHYGQDDFADRKNLVRTLSRERAKDMASDYGREFADLHQIRVPEPLVEQAAPPPVHDPFAGLGIRPVSLEPKRGRFDGLRLSVPSTPEPQIAPTSPGRVAPARTIDRVQSPELPGAVTRHAKIVETIKIYRSIGDPPTPERSAELASSRAALNALQANGALDLETAMSVNPALISEAAKGQTAAAIRAMQLETDMRSDPQLRADTFVQRWQTLDRQRRLFMRDHEDSRVESVGRTMIGMAKSLERDPQVESLLRARKAEFGLPEMRDRGLGQSLIDMVGPTRSRGLGIGM